MVGQCWHETIQINLLRAIVAITDAAFGNLFAMTLQITDPMGEFSVTV